MEKIVNAPLIKPRKFPKFEKEEENNAAPPASRSNGKSFVQTIKDGSQNQNEKGK